MLELSDIRIIHTRSDKNYIQATHIPTGISIQVEGEGYFRTKNQALEFLEAEVAKRRR